MDKLLKIIYDIFDLFYDFSMMPFRSVPVHHTGDIS